MVHRSGGWTVCAAQIGEQAAMRAHQITANSHTRSTFSGDTRKSKASAVCSGVLRREAA